MTIRVILGERKDTETRQRDGTHELENLLSTVVVAGHADEDVLGGHAGGGRELRGGQVGGDEFLADVAAAQIAGVVGDVEHVLVGALRHHDVALLGGRGAAEVRHGHGLAQHVVLHVGAQDLARGQACRDALDEAAQPALARQYRRAVQSCGRSQRHRLVGWVCRDEGQCQNSGSV